MTLIFQYRNEISNVFSLKLKSTLINEKTRKQTFMIHDEKKSAQLNNLLLLLL